jgi:TolB protein
VKAALFLVGTVALMGCRSTASAPERSIRASATAASVPSAPASAEIRGLDCSAGRIVFTSERDGHRQLYESCPDGSHLLRLLSTASNDHVAGVSSKGALLVLHITGHGGEAGYSERLSIFDGGLAPVGEGRTRLRNPSFLGNGGALVVEADLGGLANIARLRRDGRIEPLTQDKAGSFEPAVSPDGRTIAFASSRDGDAELYRMNADGTELLRLTHSRGDDSAPSFSPDGQRLAFLSSRRGVARVHVMDADGSKPRALDSEEVIGETELAWSPDGLSLAYIAVRSDAAALRIVRVADGVTLAEDRGSFRDETPCFSPDGRFVVFASNRDGDVELYAMPSDGGAPMRVTRSPGVDFLPRWLRASVK